MPARTLKELIAYAKANPSKLSYGSAGAGTMTNLAGELFKQLIGAPEIVHIPYKGAAPGVDRLAGGHIPMMTPNVGGPLLEFHRAGKVRILAVAANAAAQGRARHSDRARGRTAGHGGGELNGLFAPAGVRRTIVDAIADETRKVMADADVQKLMVTSGSSRRSIPGRSRRSMIRKRTGALDADHEGGRLQGAMTGESPMNRRDCATRPGAAAALAARDALAQAVFPSRPIKLVVPFSAGGVNDIVGRQWAERVKPLLGSVFIENMGGAGGNIGVMEVQRAEPDGHTILLGSTSTMVLNTMNAVKVAVRSGQRLRADRDLLRQHHVDRRAPVGAGEERQGAGQPT